MSAPPANPKIYHIVHVDRLASIVADGCLWSDAVMAQRSAAGTTIGMNSIKARRRTLPVTCHPGTCVGDYVPFYFCPRSIMLYVIHRGNHPELTYRGGQEPIVHLEGDVSRVIAWAESNSRRWAIALTNAAAVYAEFRSDERALEELDWAAIEARDFRAPEVKEAKQAEFLLHGSFPWALVERIGVFAQGMARQVADAIRGAGHRPAIRIRRDWYY